PKPTGLPIEAVRYDDVVSSANGKAIRSVREGVVIVIGIVGAGGVGTGGDDRIIKGTIAHGNRNGSAVHAQIQRPSVPGAVGENEGISRPALNLGQRHAVNQTV